jgi:hypothetical protein
VSLLFEPDALKGACLVLGGIYVRKNYILSLTIMFYLWVLFLPFLLDFIIDVVK